MMSYYSVELNNRVFVDRGSFKDLMKVRLEMLEALSILKLERNHILTEDKINLEV
jgi:hypothetical protein